jgi:hypothetical protein
MNKLALFLFFLFQTQYLFADEGINKWEHHMFGGYENEFLLPGVLNTQFDPKCGPCSDLKLDEDQKTKLKEAYFKTKEKNIDIESRIQKAHLKYERIAIDLESNAESAKAASQEITSAVTSMMQAHANYKVEIMFEILKPKQRHLAHACIMHMIKFRKSSWEKHCEHEHSK